MTSSTGRNTVLWWQRRRLLLGFVHAHVAVFLRHHAQALAEPRCVAFGLLQGVKSVCLALQQSERYGTPLGQSLRVMAQENRDMRMNEAEKKAAALPPKLTVPMILFFLPVLFVVILGPTGIKVAAMQ